LGNSLAEKDAANFWSKKRPGQFLGRASNL
jgi:hypothetical protein